MSGIGYIGTCPNCGLPAKCYTDSKPFEHTDITCLHCGFFTTTHVGYMSLEELNEMRKDAGDKPLSELPEQNEKFIK